MKDDSELVYQATKEPDVEVVGYCAMGMAFVVCVGLLHSLIA